MKRYRRMNRNKGMEKIKIILKSRKMERNGKMKRTIEWG